MGVGFSPPRNTAGLVNILGLVVNQDLVDRTLAETPTVPVKLRLFDVTGAVETTTTCKWTDVDSSSETKTG